MKMNLSFKVRNASLATLGALSLLSATGFVHAQPISIPNHSFELQPGNPIFYGINFSVDAWQKASQPVWFNEEEAGFQWDQAAAVFIDADPGYANRDQDQLAYLLGLPQVALFQDDFGANYEVGESYKLTLGVFGKQLAENSSLQLSLYYRNLSDEIVSIESTTVTYLSANFPMDDPRSLIDYEVNLGVVQAGDAWAGKPIGIKIESTYGEGPGYWDVDNVRLDVVPEPATAGFLVLGGLLLANRRRRV